MKIVILEAESLGEDMKLDRFFEIGEVAIYGKTTLESARADCGGGRSDRKQAADE